MTDDDQCRCFLPTKPPEGVQGWRPDVDEDPGPEGRAVVRVGEDPLLRRAVRVGSGWTEEGSMVNFYKDITPLMSWERTGRCWAATPHPVMTCDPWPL